MKIGHNTLAELQRARLEYEHRVAQVQRDKAARHVRGKAVEEEWSDEDLKLVLDMLGINDDQPIRPLISSQWTKP
jgi:hypothetical protein